MENKSPYHDGIVSEGSGTAQTAVKQINGNYRIIKVLYPTPHCGTRYYKLVFGWMFVTPKYNRERTHIRDVRVSDFSMTMDYFFSHSRSRTTITP